MLRHRVRAGITGWAQVHGWRGNTSLTKRIEYDLYYIENWSFSLDVKILWMTLRHGLARNAYWFSVGAATEEWRRRARSIEVGALLAM